MKSQVHDDAVTVDDQRHVGGCGNQLCHGIGVERAEGLVGGFEWLHEKAAPHLT